MPGEGERVVLHARRVRCGESGVRVVNGPGTEITGGAFFLNATNGIFVESGTGIVVRNTVMWNNGYNGLRVDGGRVAVSGSVRR